jgi:aspartyl aminopeptidase
MDGRLSPDDCKIVRRLCYKKMEETIMYRKMSEEMLGFIQKNPTAFHVTATMRETLRGEGYEELSESRPWKLVPGRGYFVCRNGSSIIAFLLGSDLSDYSFHIVASHTDSPAFKLKEKAELKACGKYTKLNTEGYGGMICSTWMDRPLSIAGRVLVRGEDGTIATRLLDFDRDLVLIPSVAIHMNRNVNDGFAYNKQVDLLPLFSGSGEEGALSALIAEELGTSPDAVLGSDLYLYNRQKPSIWGVDGEFISSGRLDDQQCAFASMKALLSGGHSRSISVMACFDNEEVGSGTKQGADSTFLYDVLKRINLALGKDESDFLRAVSTSFMLSADNAHAVHPNHPEHTDDGNCTYINEGVVVKSHAGQKYTSDGMSIAVVRELAKKAEVPLQYFANRSDKAGGSTLGNIAMAHVSMNSVDIGLPQLAMHSSYETAGVKDTLYMVQLMQKFYACHLKEAAPGVLRMEE